MKKLFSVLAIMFACILCMPMFSACDGKGGTELKSMVFTQDVFEVDVGQTITLTYKVFPTTATYVRPSFLPDVDNTMFTLDTSTGKFTLVDPSCKTMTLRMVYGLGENDYDICTIVQKQYPTQIYFEKSTDTINNNSTYALRLMAQMEDGTIKAIGPNEYNIELTSSAPNVVGVDSTTMTAYSTGLSGKAQITARIKKLNGLYLGVTPLDLQGTIAQTELEVVESVDHAVVALQGENNFINTSSTRTQTAQNTYTTTQSSLKLKVLLYSADNVCINSGLVNLSVLSGNPTAQITPNTDGTYTIEFASDEGTACVQILSNATDSNGNPKTFTFYITKENSGS